MINQINNREITGKKKSYFNIPFQAKRIQPEIAQSVRNRLFNVKSWDIYGHGSPDYDTAKGAMAMADLAKRHGIKAYICIDKKAIKELSINTRKYRIKKNSKPSELALLIDHNGTDKISDEFLKILEKTPLKQIIDHHELNEKTIDAFNYIDETAHACCSVIYRFFEAWGEKLTKRTAKELASGIINDYSKSKCVKFVSTPKGSELVELENLDANSKEVLDGVQKFLSEKERTKIYNNLDFMSHLNKKEIKFREKLFSKIQVSKNGDLAYVIIDPKDKKWKDLGMDNVRTSAILRDLRLRLINNIQEDEMLSAEQRENLKNLKGIVIFYPIKRKAYQLSIHSKGDYAIKYLRYAKEAYARKQLEKPNEIIHDLVGDGHPHRAGGRIFFSNAAERESLIESFLEAAENVT